MIVQQFQRWYTCCRTTSVARVTAALQRLPVAFYLLVTRACLHVFQTKLAIRTAGEMVVLSFSESHTLPPAGRLCPANGVIRRQRSVEARDDRHVLASTCIACAATAASLNAYVSLQYRHVPPAFIVANFATVAYAYIASEVTPL